MLLGVIGYIADIRVAAPWLKYSPPWVWLLVVVGGSAVVIMQVTAELLGRIGLFEAQLADRDLGLVAVADKRRRELPYGELSGRCWCDRYEAAKVELAGLETAALNGDFSAAWDYLKEVSLKFLEITKLTFGGTAVWADEQRRVAATSAQLRTIFADRLGGRVAI